MKDLYAYLVALYGTRFTKEVGAPTSVTWSTWERLLEGHGASRVRAAVDAHVASDRGRFVPVLADLLGILNKPASAEIPEDNEEMRRWAMRRGLGDAKTGESWDGYRARLAREVKDRAPALPHQKVLGHE